MREKGNGRGSRNSNEQPGHAGSDVETGALRGTERT